MNDWLRFDWDRAERTGIPEAVLGTGKTPEQVVAIANEAMERDRPLLCTRLDDAQMHALASDVPAVALDPVGRTGALGRHPARAGLDGAVAVVAAGSSDRPVAREAANTLHFNGIDGVTEVMDVGVAGLWRLMERVDELRQARVIIAAAGMEGALFSVLGGLVPGLVIAVPTSVGYGVSEGGRAALRSALASCSPGVVAVNVDNGFGAACAALKLLRPGEASAV